MITDIFLSFFGISISISFMIVLLLLLTPLFHKRYAAKWKYWIWIVLALRLMIPISGIGGQSDAEVRQGAAHTVSESLQEPSDAPIGGAVRRRVIVEIPAQMTTPIAMQSEKNDGNLFMRNLSALDMIALVWMAGCLLFISVHVFSCFHYKHQILKKGRIVKDRDVLGLLLKLKRELHIKSTVTVIEYAEAASPMLIGFLYPVLVLPEEQHHKGGAYSQEELFFILKHELVHLKRGDILIKLLFMTANAVHWFNPLVWIMQKEAAVDMELSCDEQVTWGSDFATRKAYTETLLSTLHKQNKKRTLLSTGFYGGKEIMKKRFKNILGKTQKKNGAVILAAVAVLAVSLGTLAGCSVEKEKAEDLLEQTGSNGGPEDMNANIFGGTEGESNSGENSASEENAQSAAENTKILTIIKEGEPEEKRATLVVENKYSDQYSFYLPDGEWQKEEADMWRAVVNEDVHIWVARFEEDYHIDVAQMLADDGYVQDNGELVRQEEGIVYKVRMYENDSDVWCVFYSYPVEAEEGWGRELPVIADTFAIIDSGDMIHGYISGYDSNSITIDEQLWVTFESEDWKPEYNEDAGFEVVDAEGGDVTYPLHEECAFFILENHYDPTIELSRDEFINYLAEMEYPVLWIFEVKEGQIRSVTEQYLP